MKRMVWALRYAGTERALVRDEDGKKKTFRTKKAVQEARAQMIAAGVKVLKVLIDADEDWTCDYCKSPITGQASRRYCDDNCKAMALRRRRGVLERSEMHRLMREDNNPEARLGWSREDEIADQVFARVVSREGPQQPSPGWESILSLRGVEL